MQIEAMANVVEGLVRAAELAELWASMSEGHADVSRKKGDLRQADRLTHIARAYRALARTYRVEAEKEPTNPYNLLKGEWLSAGPLHEPEV
jgi:hypothetical protein